MCRASFLGVFLEEEKGIRGESPSTKGEFPPLEFGTPGCDEEFSLRENQPVDRWHDRLSWHDRLRCWSCGKRRLGVPSVLLARSFVLTRAFEESSSPRMLFAVAEWFSWHVTFVIDTGRLENFLRGRSSILWFEFPTWSALVIQWDVSFVRTRVISENYPCCRTYLPIHLGVRSVGNFMTRHGCPDPRRLEVIDAIVVWLICCLAVLVSFRSNCRHKDYQHLETSMSNITRRSSYPEGPTPTPSTEYRTDGRLENTKTRLVIAVTTRFS